MTSPALEKHFTEVADGSPIPVVLYRWEDHDITIIIMNSNDNNIITSSMSSSTMIIFNMVSFSVSLQILQLTFQWLQ